MSRYEDEVPAYLTIRVTPQHSPIAAFADEEAWRARSTFPDLQGVGVGEFFWARERDMGGWELSEHGAPLPQQARDSLGSHFRKSAKEARDRGEEKAADAWAAAARRMDRKALDDISVRGENFRIVRATHFVRSGPNGPEPPRPSDPDPAEPGEADQLASPTKGFVVDPYQGTGLSHGLLKLDLIHFQGRLPGAPDEIAADAREAALRYPGGVLLPPVFIISERVNGCWGVHAPGSSHSTPQGARDYLSDWLRIFAPVMLGLTEEQRAVYARAADDLDARRRNALSVDGHRFRVTRVDRLMRIGPDGPERPRPSDFDPDPPIEVQARRLKAEEARAGDAGTDEPTDPTARAKYEELRALFEADEARRAALKAQKRIPRPTPPPTPDDTPD
jgi:hypothetical protein